ncbi:MAG: hypothetical protein RMY64_13810 [Nostoc sp. DedQUE08]|nr:hypothetical protein [Nostoc sp. DedQUE08]
MLIVKQFAIVCVIHAGVWSSRDKFLGKPTSSSYLRSPLLIPLMLNGHYM